MPNGDASMKRRDDVMREDEGRGAGRLFISERELAWQLGVHPSTLTRLAQQGHLPVEPVHVGHRRVYPRAAVEKLAGGA